MDICATQPPLFRMQNRQAAACHLHAAHPRIEGSALTDLLPT
jgi:hypothetical protein